MSTESWRVVFAYGAIQGLVLTIALLVNRRGPRSANVLLAAILASVLLVVAPWVLAMYGRPEAAARLVLYVTFPVAASTIPLYYFYVRSFLIPDCKLRVMLVLPAVLFPGVLNSVTYIVGDVGVAEIAKEMQGLLNGDVLAVASKQLLLPITTVVYKLVFFYLAWRVIKKVEVGLKDSYSIDLRRHVIWLRVLTVGILVLTIQPMIPFLIMFTSQEYSFWVECSLLLPRCIFIQFVAVTALFLPEGFTSTFKDLVTPSHRAPIAGDVAEPQIRRLKQFMEVNKLYRDENLRLADLADKLSIPPHVLSQLINDHLHVNFLSFVNEYRVREAKLLLQKPDNDHYTFLAIAKDAGFNSRASFNRVFKKHAGMSPSQYRTLCRSGVVPAPLSGDCLHPST